MLRYFSKSSSFQDILRFRNCHRRQIINTLVGRDSSNTLSTALAISTVTVNSFPGKIAAQALSTLAVLSYRYWDSGEQRRLVRPFEQLLSFHDKAARKVQFSQ
jgi:hypothetical protein